MKELERELTIINNTSCFGLINDKTVSFDDQRIFSQYLISFRPYKIRCWVENKEPIEGIEIIYKNRLTSQEEKGITIKKNNLSDEIEVQEFIFEYSEMINAVTLWKDNGIYGIQIKTNKNRTMNFGNCQNYEKVEIDEFEDGKNYLVGYFLGFDKTFGITNIGFYYMNKRTYYLMSYFGILCLRVKLKNQDFKNALEKKIGKFNYSDKALYKTCLLPNSQFFEVFKFIFA